MIITPFGRDLPYCWSGLRTPLRFSFLLRRETPGLQMRLRECIATLAPDAHLENARRAVRFWDFCRSVG